jgi:hypothetical protein
VVVDAALGVRSIRLVVFPIVSVVQLDQYGAGPPNDACERADGSQSALLGVHASVSCCW